LLNFFNKVTGTVGMAEFIVEPKIDGLAMNLTYSNGKLVSAVTRGDGVSGKLVTENVRCFVPDSIKFGDAEIRGEVYISRASLTVLNNGRKAQGLATYKTCQSAAVASLMNESANVCKARSLKFVAYDMGYGKSDAATNQAALVIVLKKLGFAVLDHSKVRTFEGMLRASKRVFAESKYPADGSVVKLNSFDGQHAIGVTKTCPIWAIAYKGDTK